MNLWLNQTYVKDYRLDNSTIVEELNANYSDEVKDTINTTGAQGVRFNTTELFT